MRVAVLADCHIDHGVHGLWADEAWRRATADIAAERFDLAVIAGDLFHTGRPTAEAIMRCIDGLKAMTAAGVPVLVVAGNHEWTGVNASQGHRPPTMLLDEVEGVTTMYQPGEYRAGELWVGALPWPAPGKHSAERDQADNADRLADAAEQHDGPTLLAAHAAVSEVMHHSGSETEMRTAATSSSTAGLADLDLTPFGHISLGHIHARQSLSPTCSYVGGLEAFTFIDEGRVGGWSELAHTGDGDGGWEETFRPAGVRNFATLNIGDDPSEHEPGTIVRVRVKEGESPFDLDRGDIEQAGLKFAGLKTELPETDGERTCVEGDTGGAVLQVDDIELLDRWSKREKLSEQDEQRVREFASAYVDDWDMGPGGGRKRQPD